MTKRLAIQFSGHLRTFDKTYKSFYENVILPNKNAGYEIDVFMHTWDELEYTAEQWHNKDFPELRGKKLTKEQVDFVEKNYNPVKWEYTPQIDTGDNTVFPEFTGGCTAYQSMVNVWYTKYRVNELRLEYEKQNNITYDYVINTRADIYYKTPFVIDDILEPYNSLLRNIDTVENKLFFSGCHRSKPVKTEQLLAASDILYFGKPNVINKSASIYSELNKEELNKHFISWEYYLIYTAHKYSIMPVQLKYALNKDWKILRFDDIYKQKGKGFKFISLRIRKNFIQLIFCNLCFKLEFGVWKDE